jgi:hypothetical protein
LNSLINPSEREVAGNTKEGQTLDIAIT